MDGSTTSRVLDGFGVLSDPVRRRIYDHVAAQDHPVRRDQVAGATGVSRSLAAYHLDKLAEAGLLRVSYARPGGRTGPGAGRPAKHYARSTDEISASLPPRDYALLARLFADALATVDLPQVREAVAAAAERAGRELADRGTDLPSTLTAGGYEPVAGPDDEIVLRNCPFRHLAQQHTELVCGLNLALVRGLLASRHTDPERARLSPTPDRCCVTIQPAGV